MSWVSWDLDTTIRLEDSITIIKTPYIVIRNIQWLSNIEYLSRSQNTSLFQATWVVAGIATIAIATAQATIAIAKATIVIAIVTHGIRTGSVELKSRVSSLSMNFTICTGPFIQPEWYVGKTTGRTDSFAN